ncbi:MAG: hypothetical protein IPH62_19230 [Ignavibacteriae bacterium]|nr:hypothetical protein [Ignavibacteriota bacterium]
MNIEETFNLYKSKNSISFFNKVVLFISELYFILIIIFEFILDFRVHYVFYILLAVLFLYIIFSRLKIIIAKPYDDRLAGISYINSMKFRYWNSALTKEEKSIHPFFNLFYTPINSILFFVGSLLPVLFLLIVLLALLIKIF